MVKEIDSLVDLRPELENRLSSYENLSFNEQFAMYMGKVQLLELGLKRVLADNFNYDFDTMDNWSLGYVKTKLEEEKIRPDFIVMLRSVVKARNFIAHEILAAEAMFNSLLENNNITVHHRQLSKAIFELEQIILHFELNQEYASWLPSDDQEPKA